ncbi:hypothetical protein FRC09_013800 [Ceratobasidium sp. 395]|nr:hypothetical protein FRC09_013800 [Ceratobasidium sp. 395]
MGGFIGRTPSPGARTRELEDEVDDVPPPPPPPPLPLPAFKATHGRKHSSSDPSAGIMRPRPSTSDRPATTNVRSASERAEMLKKARKIQQLLGDVPTEDACEGSFYRHSRAARSEDFGDDEFPVRLGGRRHSNPGTFSDVVVTGDQGEEKEGAGGAEGAKVGRVPSQNRNQLKRGFHRPTASASSALQLLPPMTPVSPALISPDSYGLLSPEPETAKSVDEDRGKVGSEAGVGSPKSEKPLIEDSLGLGDETEDELALARRAKRAKVAKLNRYLGSRVPAHLVLGLDESWDYEQGLPEPEPESGVKTEERGLLERTGSGLRVGGRRKVEVEEQEEEIGDLSVMSSEEKARAVRRKAKMEKMFGERPPQKLYQPQSGGDTSGTTALDNLVEGSEGDEEEWEEEGGGEHYKSYRASFNSLAYFVNNADRDSLEGLYNIVSALPESDDQGAEGEEPGDGGKPMRSQFAARRKRAAKLSKFFGVSYRDLFGAVLDILESDVREDKEEGSLSAAETQDLLIKLRKLKAKGEDIRV